MQQLTGLTTEQSLEQLAQFGPNEIKINSHNGPIDIFFRQIKGNFIVYLLLGGALLSLLVGKSVTAFTIFFIIIIITIIGFLQEYKAEKAVEALQRMITPISTVIRNGKKIEIPSREIVPDDLIVLRMGERVPADSIIVESHDLQTNEASLTGESKEVDKISSTDFQSATNENKVFMGTFVTRGHCIAKVQHTGLNTEFGKIAQMLSGAHKNLRLHDQIEKISKQMVTIALSASVLVGVILFFRLETITPDGLSDIIITVVALSVSAFPEGLPVVLILTLSLAAYRMAQKNAIVKRISVIESLGEVNVICSDKTGTITAGEMTVKKIFTNRLFEVSGTGYEIKGTISSQGNPVKVQEDEALFQLVKGSVLCNDSEIERSNQNPTDYIIKGTPTEGALQVLGSKAGVFSTDFLGERIEEIPFSPEKKFMAIIFKENKKMSVFVKGASEVVLSHCTHILNEKSETVLLTPAKRNELKKIHQEWADEKLRVMTVASKTISQTTKDDSWNKDLVFLGFLGIEDPPRPEVKKTIESCQSAGIEVKMITGDGPETAISVGKEVGLTGRCITGIELDKLTDDELAKIMDDIAIFARVRPDHKLRIIRALKANNKIVAMTGDGVNDAPALKEAHVGVAMGKNGTDVSREAADLILKDDNFATLVYAIHEGRTVFHNIQKFVTYQLSCNYAELFIIFAGILIGLPLPLLALQILFMNIVTDNLPAITLGFQPASIDSMRKQQKGENILIQPIHFRVMLISGFLMGIIGLGVFYTAIQILHYSLPEARSVALFTLVGLEIVHAFNMRSFRHPIHQSNFLSNQWLAVASIISILATLLVIYSPLNELFGLAPIAMELLLYAGLAALSIGIIFDVWKVRSQPNGIIS